MTHLLRSIHVNYFAPFQDFKELLKQALTTNSEPIAKSTLKKANTWRLPS